MNNGKQLDQLAKEELIEKVKKGREYYLKLTKSVENAHGRKRAALIREKETFTESIAERDKQIVALTEQLEKLNAAVTAAFDLIPLAPGKEPE